MSSQYNNKKAYQTESSQRQTTNNQANGGLGVNNNALVSSLQAVDSTPQKSQGGGSLNSMPMQPNQSMSMPNIGTPLSKPS